MRYSVLSLAWNAPAGQKKLVAGLRDAAPRNSYDVIVIGGGGHGLATAYYLQSSTASPMSPCLRKAGSAPAMLAATPRYPLELPARRQTFHLRMVDEAVGRSRTRLNYTPWSASAASIKSLSSDPQRDAYARRGQCHEIALASMPSCSRRWRAALLPYLDFDDARFPIRGGLLQRRGGTARHDAVVWGYAARPTNSVSTSSEL